MHTLVMCVGIYRNLRGFIDCVRTLRCGCVWKLPRRYLMESVSRVGTIVIYTDYQRRCGVWTTQDTVCTRQTVGTWTHRSCRLVIIRNGMCWLIQRPLRAGTRNNMPNFLSMGVVNRHRCIKICLALAKSTGECMCSHSRRIQSTRRCIWGV